jgi:hypothetical protein
MGHSRTPTQNTAGDGFRADPIDGTARLPRHGDWREPNGDLRRVQTVHGVGQVFTAFCQDSRHEL